MCFRYVSVGHLSGSYSLSNNLWIVAGLSLEGAVVGPQIHGICDAGHASLVDQFSSLSARYGKLEVCIFLPITEEQRELGEEAIVDIAHRSDGL